MGLFDNFFSKGPSDDISFEKQVRDVGIDSAAGRIADLLNEKINGRRDFAKQFVLEELDAASHGDEKAINFVVTSGVPAKEYEGAMQQTNWDEDDMFNQIQMLFRDFTFCISDSDLRATLSLAVVEKIMKKYLLGRYDSSENEVFDPDLLNLNIESNQSEDGLFCFLFTGLNAAFSSVPLNLIPESHEKNLFMMSFAYAGRTLSAGMFAQGLVSRSFFNESHNKFIEWQKGTEHSVQFQEEASAKAIEFLQRYDDRLTKELIGILVTFALNPNSIDHTENGTQYSYETIIEIFLKLLADGANQNSSTAKDFTPHVSGATKKSKPPKILVRAIDADGEKSAPFRIYDAKGEELPKQFFLKIETAENRDGEEVLRIGNGKLGLLVISRRPDYWENILNGFCREAKGMTVVLCEKFVDDIPSVATAKNAKAY